MNERHQAPPFVGDDRHQAVERLVAAFDRVAAGGGPELVCLVAPIGWGKTRIVQELYARLAADRQDDPPYWPPSVVEATDVTEPTKLRKRVHPGRFEVPGGAVPSWMWWALSCQRKADGQPAQAIEESKEQLFAHAEALEQSLTKVQRLRQGLTPDQVRGKASALAGLLGVFVPPVGWAATVHDSVSQLYELGQGVFEARRRQERLEGDRTVDAEQSDRSALVDELASSLVRLSTEPAPLPVVVVVDDAHEAAPSTVALVQRLLASPVARVLVVATAWPDALALQAQERRGFGGWLDAFDPDSSCRVDLVSLPEVDLERLVRVVAPATALEVVAGLVDRAGGNPFVLGLILSLPLVRRSIAGDAITLSAAQVAVVPNEVRRLYLEKWLDLPEAVREALAVASVQGAVFVEDCVREAASAVGLGAGADALPEARDPYAWVRLVDDAVRAFVEPSQFDVTLQAATGEMLTEAEIDHVRAALVEYLLARRGDGTFGALTADAQHLLLRQHVLFVEQGLVSGLGAAGDSALLLARQLASVYAYREAVDFAERALRWLTDSRGADHAETLGLRGDLASWLAWSGQVAEATEQFEGLLADQVRVLGADHLESLRTRSIVAFLMETMGQVAEAVEQFEGLLADQMRVLGADHRDTLVTRGNLIWGLGELGRQDEAAALFERLVGDRSRVLGEDHPDTLTARNSLAIMLAELGRLQAAEAQFKVVIVERARVLGADHPDTFAARHGLALTLGDLGRVDEERTLLEELLADQVRVLGADHPGTLATRHNLAVSLSEGAEAVSHFDALLSDRTRVLGSDHPDTLATRHGMAVALGESGRVDEAVIHLAELLADRVRVLGPDHPLTLQTREMLAVSMAESGRAEDAVLQLQALLADRIRVLGEDHPGTFANRHNLAWALTLLGRTDDALAQQRALLEDQLRVLGADHPDTLASRHNLAWGLHDLGQMDEALDQFERLLLDRRRVCGEGHPDTLSTINDLEYVRGEVGDDDGSGTA